MNGKHLAVVLGIVAIAATGAWFLMAKSDDQKFIEACEKVLSGRLKSPSSYKFIKFIGPKIEKSSGIERVGYLRYEADNSFGAAIAGTAECSLNLKSVDEKIGELQLFSMRVNGQTAMDWDATEALRATNNAVGLP